MNDFLSKYFLGIDSGASKIEISVVSEEGELVRTVVIERSGNPASVGIEKYCENLLHALDKILSYVSPREVVGVGIGLAGYLEGLWNNDIINCLSRKLLINRDNVSIFEDIVSAHASIHLLKDGVIGILGTGSNFYGVCGEKIWRVGGWGHLIDDRGGAYSFGSRALSYVVKSLDGRIGYTRLIDYAFKLYNVSNIHELVSKIYSSDDPKKLIASFAPYVFKAAREKDPYALKILDEEISEITLAIETIYRRLNCLDMPLGIIGSVYRENRDLLKNRIEAELERIFSRKFEILEPRIKPSCASSLAHMKKIVPEINTVVSNLLRTCGET